MSVVTLFVRKNLESFLTYTTNRSKFKTWSHLKANHLKLLGVEKETPRAVILSPHIYLSCLLKVCLKVSSPLSIIRSSALQFRSKLLNLQPENNLTFKCSGPGDAFPKLFGLEEKKCYSQDINNMNNM